MRTKLTTTRSPNRLRGSSQRLYRYAIALPLGSEAAAHVSPARVRWTVAPGDRSIWSSACDGITGEVEAIRPGSRRVRDDGGLVRRRIGCETSKFRNAVEPHSCEAYHQPCCSEGLFRPAAGKNLVRQRSAPRVLTCGAIGQTLRCDTLSIQPAPHSLRFANSSRDLRAQREHAVGSERGDFLRAASAQPVAQRPSPLLQVRALVDDDVGG